MYVCGEVCSQLIATFALLVIEQSMPIQKDFPHHYIEINEGIN